MDYSLGIYDFGPLKMFYTRHIDCIICVSRDKLKNDQKLHSHSFGMNYSIASTTEWRAVHLTLVSVDSVESAVPFR